MEIANKEDRDNNKAGRPALARLSMANEVYAQLRKLAL